MKVQNAIEDLVEALLPDILKSYNELCKCEQCVNDIKAIALNNIPPKYVATKKGIILSKAGMFTIQSEIDVKKEIVIAIEKVKETPRHNGVNNV